MLLDPALALLSRWTGAVLLAARLIMAVVMLFYGWPKIRDPRKNAKDFDATGFRPGWLLGIVVKATKWDKPFTDYSYDLLLLALCLLRLALGPGAYRV
jgi:DoxX-like protein